MTACVPVEKTVTLDKPLLAEPLSHRIRHAPFKNLSESFIFAYNDFPSIAININRKIASITSRHFNTN
jgi:hypothetical protein